MLNSLEKIVLRDWEGMYLHGYIHMESRKIQTFVLCLYGQAWALAF